MKHNNILPNGHFHKHWRRYLKTWFDQPGRKKSHRLARAMKAVKNAPRPVDGLLRPAVRAPTLKYNMKLREGRGFTLEELKGAGINPLKARSIGIAVDHRRHNRSEESLKTNIARLKEYKSRLIVLPKKKKTNTKYDKTSSKADTKKQYPNAADILSSAGPLVTRGRILPIVQQLDTETSRTISPTDSKAKSAYATLREARSAAKLVGLHVKSAEKKNKMAF